MVGVAEADERMENAARSGEIGGGAVQEDVGLAGFFALYFDISPADLPPDAGAESLRDGFLRGEASAVVSGGKGHGGTVIALSLGEDAAQETLAESIDGGLDAGGFDDIDADAEDAGGGLRRGRMKVEG
jgi:hypothetical protein